MEEEKNPLVIVEGQEPLSPPNITQNPDNKQEPCFKAYESCRVNKELELYEKYMFQNRTSGTMCALFAFGPLIIFFGLIWPSEEYM